MIFSAALFVLAVLLIGGVMLLQAQRAAVPVMRDVDVYAEQLRGLERDLAKGVLRDEEFAAMRAEIGRRMISAAAHRAISPIRAHKTAGYGLLRAAVFWPVCWARAFIAKSARPLCPIALSRNAMRSLRP